MQKTHDGKQLKSRYWAFILYPESAPKNWVHILRETYLPIAISPLHDKDIFSFEETDDPAKIGKLKKPHYHVMLVYGNTTTSSFADELSLSLGQTHCIIISHPWGYYQYLDHDLITDKAIYKHSDIKLLGGLTEYQLHNLTKEDEQHLTIEIFNFIEENCIVEYRDLIIKCMSYDLDAYDYVKGHTLLFNTYIQSFRNKRKAEEMAGMLAKEKK